MTPPELSPNAPDDPQAWWLERTRSRVLNILVLDGLTILGSALAIRRWGSLDFGVDPLWTKRTLFGSLIAVVLVAMFVLRGLGGRDRLREPVSRGPRYLATRVGAVAVGWLVLPVGLAYGLLVDPSLGGVAPFWLAALVLGRLGFPRREDLDEFDEPMPSVMEGAS